MGILNKRFYGGLVSFFVIFSLLYSPVYVLSRVYADGDGGSNRGDGNAGGATFDGSMDIGIDSKGQLDGDPNIANIRDGLATFADLVIGGLCSGCSATKSAVNVALGTNTTIGEDLFGGRSLVGDAGRAISGAVLDGIKDTTGIDLRSGSISEVQVETLSGVQVEVSLNPTTGQIETTVTPENGDPQIDTKDFLDSTESWGERVTEVNLDIASNPDPSVEPQAVSLSVSEREVEQGASVNISWNSEPGSVCVTQGYKWLGTVPAQGSVDITDIQKDQGFLIECTKTIEIPSGSDNGQPTLMYETGLAYAEVFVRESAPTTTPTTTPARPVQQQRPNQQQTQQRPAQQQVVGASSDSAQGLSISITPSSVSMGGDATISWSVEGQRSCVFR